MRQPTFEELADLSPNMRVVLRENSKAIHARDTYWITLQGMAARGLVDRPKRPSKVYTFTELGLAYKKALMERDQP